MNVKGVIVEQIDWDGKSKSLTMQPDYRRGDLWVAFPTDYDEPRSGPFYFQNPSYEKQYDSNVAQCSARKIANENFYKENGLYTFKTVWHNIPTDNEGLTYYALYLPEYAIPTGVSLYHPRNIDKQFKRTVLKDKQKPRYIIYLKCSSRYGVFNFNLECKFREDKKGFDLSGYSDEFQTGLYSNPEDWQYLMNEKDKKKTQKFFADQIVVNNGNFEQVYKPTGSGPKLEVKKKFKLELSHKIALASLLIAFIVLLFGNNILERLKSHNTLIAPGENLLVKVTDVYYLSDSSKSDTYPDAFKKGDGGIILSQDDITQNETMKILWLDKKPIIKFTIANTNTTKPFTLLGVYLEINSKEFLLKISTQYDKDEPIICPPNSNVEYTGVPISYPVYRIENAILHLEWKPEESQKLYPLYIQPTKPTEISGRLVIQFEDSTAMTFNQPFRINKKIIKDLKPSLSM